MNPGVHRHTPKIVALDSRGLPIRQMTYLRRESTASPIACIARQQNNPQGQLSAQWDARLTRPNQTMLYSRMGTVLLSESGDAGWRLTLYGTGGQFKEHWDSRGNHEKHEYDAQLRPVTRHERLAGELHQAVECRTYGARTEASARHNQCGQLIRIDDTAGTLQLDQYGLLGTLLIQNRHFLKTLQRPDWPPSLEARDELLEQGEGFQTRRSYNPNGELLRQVDARGHRQSWYFDRAGQLQQVHLQLKSNTTVQKILHSLSYNAQGRIESQTTGNNTTTSSLFDLANGRLQRRVTNRAGRGRQQELSYQYDASGNMLERQDHAQPTHYFASQQVDATNFYTYDSLSQLMSATGREAPGQSIRPELPDLAPNPGDSSRLLNYTEHYEYDKGGNLFLLRHESSYPGQAHRRAFNVAEDSNRALPWDEHRPPDFAGGFDANGNLQGLPPHDQQMLWSGLNQLQQITLVSRDRGEDDAEYYIYDHQRLRVRKQHRSLASSVTHVREVRYLPGLEIRMRDDSEHLEVITVEAQHGQMRCLHWVTVPPDDIKQDQMRYCLKDHLGSSTLELDGQADIISDEDYYPYGGTARWAARNEVEARYKTIRYSGKERDASGLYDYGLRYYAPWLCRWICPDPAGNVDGLNRYAMVGNNPIVYRDALGKNKTPINKDIFLVWAGEEPEKLKVHTANINNTVAQADGYKVHLYLETYDKDAFSETVKELNVHDVNYLQGSDIFKQLETTPAARIYNDFRYGHPKNLAFAVDVLRVHLVNTLGGIYSDVDDVYHDSETATQARLGSTQLDAEPDQILTLHPIMIEEATSFEIANSSFAAHANNAVLSATLDEMVVRFDNAVKSVKKLDPMGLGVTTLLYYSEQDRSKLLTSITGPGVLTDVMVRKDKEMNLLISEFNEFQSGKTTTPSSGLIGSINARMPLSRYISFGSFGSWK